MSKALWLEFVVDGICGLCGNKGVVDTETFTASGRYIVLKNYPCICPNGRLIKKARKGKVWKYGEKK